ncbi:very-long-chain (3R)-3-hydroxyacyl-CoA dehydratase-like isoform X2 [Pyrus x bretschneideri]|nr:very-long-chain (3R)-3-hydroxyacyl-CoA dehydratase-like isoform X2 [Pyrus x bretschneideri]XP_048420750.1 very-long-chain (3R)-3-hydroxyacyl-CoA dehydratase-like isoform X2 [Pyrus x bretschneideri]
MQWAGRAHFLYVVRQTHEVQESPSVFITFVAWSLTEVIRYPHYAFNCTGSCPSWITYLRYTAFIVLYPPGMAGETWLTYQALPFINKKSLSPHFSAGLSFSYYNFLRSLAYGWLDRIEPVSRKQPYSLLFRLDVWTLCQLAGLDLLGISLAEFRLDVPPPYFLKGQVDVSPQKNKNKKKSFSCILICFLKRD